jgi:hypothetical protein
MDTINLDLIAFASDLALAVNLAGGVIFAVVIRRLWLAAERKAPAPRPTLTASASNAHSCPAL